jgi:Protein of unknown function (DUF992)
MTFPRAISLTALAVAGGLAAAPAQAQNVQAGTLVCDVSGGVGMIIASQRQMACTFNNSRGEPEVYVGRIRRFGLDIGATAGGQIVWAVFAPSGRYSRGALAGTYSGASAEATVVAGLGANVLLGGSNRSIALQPVSLQGQAGLNVAAGVADLQLQAAQPVRRR